MVVLELGSNDALRGLSLTMTEQNLRNMAQAARQADADVVIVGMQIPPTTGATTRFAQLFPTVAKDEKPGSSLPDGRHCDEPGHVPG